VVINRLVPTIRSVAEAGAGVLLIEQFATLALGLANRAYIMEGGRIQYSGMAKELRDNPAMLQSAYLLRTRNGAGTPQPVPGAQLHPK
jgi:branched-chain amino acid transport system ATP-binding protein